MDPLFPALPSDLSGLSDELLEQHRTDALAAVEKIKAQDADFLGDRTAEQILTELQAGVEAVERVRDELAVRAEAAENYTSEVDELASRAEKAAAEAAAAAADAVADDEAADAATADESETAEVAAEAETLEPEAVEELEQEAVAASAEPDKKPMRRPLPRATKRHQPAASDADATAFTASAGIRGFQEGQPLDRLDIAKAIIAKRERIGTSPAGTSEPVIVASASFKERFPEERILRGDDNDNDKIKALVGEDALVASGGLCAPVTPFYEVPNFAVADRPVRDALAGFQATRGGVNVAPPPTISSISTAISTITAAQDLAGGSAGTKTCQRIDCPQFAATYLEAIAHCIEVGNLGARAWPEQVAQFVELVMAAHARTAETKLLDGIAAGSTAVTGAANNGAVNSLLGHILEAAAGMRSRHRMRDGVQLRAILPAWVADLLVLDIVRGQFDRFSRDRNGVRALLGMFGINASFTLDGPTGASQVFGAQTAAAILHFPTSVVWFLFPEGTWLFLDGGTLDLGLVRDSVLNATNDYQLFGETFENVAKIGPESLKITSTLCPSGAVTAPGSAVACS